MNDWIYTTVVFGDVGVYVKYRPSVGPGDSEKFVWLLAGEETPERELLQHMLYSNYQKFMQSALREDYKQQEVPRDYPLP